MRHEERASLFDILATIFDIIHIPLAQLVVFCFFIAHVNKIPFLRLLSYCVLFDIMLLIIFFCILQIIAELKPKWIDLNDMLDDYELHLSHDILDGIVNNPSQNNKFSELDIIRNDESSNDLIATMIIDRKNGQVVELIYPVYENNKRIVAQYGPSRGLHPSLLVGCVTDGEPEILIEDDLAILLSQAIRCADARNFGEERETYRTYLFENCYGAVPYRTFTSKKRAEETYPTSHNLSIFTKNE